MPIYSILRYFENKFYSKTAYYLLQTTRYKIHALDSVRAICYTAVVSVSFPCPHLEACKGLALSLSKGMEIQGKPFQSPAERRGFWLLKCSLIFNKKM